MTQDQIELHILRKYAEQYRTAELQSPGSKCAHELDMRDVLSGITGENGQELQYSAGHWLDRLAPRNRDSRGPLRRCSDSNVNEQAHRWHARAWKDGGSGSAPAWDRLRELEARLPLPQPKPKLWKRIGKWLLDHILTVVLTGAITAVVGAYAVRQWGPQNKPRPPGEPAALIQFENRKPFVDRAVAGDDRTRNYWNVWYFRIGIHNNLDTSTIRVKYVKLTDWQYQEGDVFKPWENAEEVPLEWPVRQPREISPQDTVYVPFARIFPPELQKVTDGLLSGDISLPQLRFPVAGWPRRMTSHIPPGTHRFKLHVFFEQAAPISAAFELEWPGKQRDNIDLMAQEVKLRILKPQQP